jgi:YHS domain-containing protein
MLVFMVSRFIIYAVIIYIIFRIIKHAFRTQSAQKNKDQSQSENVQREDLLEDPVCHTYIPLSQAYEKELAGIKYYFCSKECCDRFITSRNNERQ